MTMEDRIKAAITKSIDVHHMQLVNESHKHLGHAGDDGSGQTHFKLIIVSNEFYGYDRVQRQRLVNTALESSFAEGLHAISMKLYTAEEFEV